MYIPLGPLKKKKKTQEIKLGNGCSLELVALTSKFEDVLEVPSADSRGERNEVSKGMGTEEGHCPTLYLLLYLEQITLICLVG